MNKNLKLKLTIAALNQSSPAKKALIISLLSASLLLVSIVPGFASGIQPVTLDNSEAIAKLRKFYNSPVKDLNKIIKQTGKTPQGIPIFSFVSGKSYVDNEFSQTKPVNEPVKMDAMALFNWVSNDGKYSRFGNDPVYTQNVGVTRGDKTAAGGSKFDYNNIETSVVTLRINGKIAYDFEVIVWPDGTVSVPIKTLAEVLDVPVEQNHVNHNLTFTQPISEDQISIDYKNNQILAGTNLLEIKNPKLVYIEEGFLVKNDIFVPENIARDLLDVRTDFTQENYAMDLTTKRVLKALVQISEPGGESSSFVIEDPMNTITEAEKENKFLSLKKFNYNIGSSMNATSSYNNNSNNASANAGFSATGNFLGGEFNLGANINHGQQGLMINGYRASLDYIKPKYELSLGATNARLSDIATPGASIWGVRFGSVGAANGSSVVPRLIQGKANDNSYVELYVNGVQTDRQMVRNGQFEFDSIQYPKEPMVHIVVEQIGENGDKNRVYDRKFSQDADLLAPGQKQFLLFSGIDSSALGQSLSLYGDRFNSSYVQPVKFISGVKYRMGLSENLTMGVNYAKDILIRQPSKLFATTPTNISSARVYRTGRSSSGSVITLDLDYVPTQNLRISSEFGMSTATSKVDPVFDPTGTDFGGFIEADYRKKDFSLRAKAFSYGPNFYSPGAYNLIDKRGIELNSSWKVGKVNLSGGLTKYDSNLDDYFEGGRASVLDYQLYASGAIDKNSDIRAGMRSQGASNSLYYDRDTTFDITINRRLSDKANLVMNYAKNIRQTKSMNQSTVNKSSNNMFNAELTYDADKLGIIRLAHEMMMLDPVDRLIMAEVSTDYMTEPVYSKNIRLTLDRNHLPIKGFTFSPNVGYRYGGENKGLNFGANLGYIFRNGRQLMVNYAYNSSFGKYMTGALSFGGSNSHSLSFNFVDTIGFGKYKNSKTNNAYNSAFDPNNGVIKGSVFLDLNQNGIKDEGENGVSDVDINFQDLFSVTTDKDGNFIAANIPKGLRKVGIEKETLPVIYTPTIADALVNVKAQKVYVANLGVIVTPGSISGKVNVKKDKSTNSEVVVLLLNDKGKEVKYTTTDSTGGFYLESLAPGEYTLVVDRNYLDYKGLQSENKEAHKVSIPMVTDDFVDIEGIELNLIPKQGEIQKF